MKQKDTECLACLLRPLLFLGCLLGGSPIKVSCPHSFNPSCLCKFEKSSLNFLLSSVAVLPVVASVAVYAYKLRTFQLNDPIDVLIHTAEVALSLSTIVTYISGKSNIGWKLRELNGLSVIIDCKRIYGVSVFIAEKDAKKYLLLNYAAGAVTFLIIAVNVAYMDYFSNKVYADVLSKTTLVLNTYVQTISAFHFIAGVALYKIMFKASFQQLEHVLTEKLNVGSLLGYDGDFQQALPLEEYLKRTTRLYTALLYNYTEMNGFLSPSFLIHLVIVVAVLTLDIFIAVVVPRHTVIENVPLSIRCAGCVLGIVLFIIISEEVYDVSEDVLSFLFKYPISKLNSTEVAQVETLIRTLIIQKPIIRVSDIFTIGTGLLASISGTVVTYVLVALQFHASSAKE